ncbi:MAG TPA: hypothetical protein P5099_04015 [Candidatus Moranbacteria bacterium]|nr:hypothetical protein [Candidatus Moranbacteria bacterium]HSA08509.1 hypothetical protein [Candidatus Moranbacteria bacterium]
MTNNQKQTDDIMSESEKAHKIEMLRQMMLNAEKTMQSAKAMLLQLEGKKKTGRKRKVEEDTDGTVIEGTFDGQIMIGTDGKQYPVPANYASKSKLVEGDVLKLTITPDGSFVYKQIGPAQRKSVIGIVSQDEKGNYFIFSEGKPYKVLLASITYFKAEPGDEVVVMIPRELDATWAAIENVISKGGHDFSTPQPAPQKEKKTKNKLPASTHGDDRSSTRGWPADGGFSSWKDDLKNSDIDMDKDPEKEIPAKEELVDEWAADIDALEKEIAAQS